MADTLVPVRADTATDFMDNGQAAMGSGSELGDCDYKVACNVTTDNSTGAITKATLSLTTSIRRVHWVGKEKTQPDRNNMQAIQRIEEMTRKHEDAHRAAYVAAFQKHKAALEKKLVGLSPSDIDGVVEEMNEKLRDACEELHKRSGDLSVTVGANGSITIREQAAGPGGCR